MFLGTYAWFKGVSVLSIQDYKIVLADKTLKISTSPTGNFKDMLTSEDLKDAIPEYYGPVSTIFGGLNSDNTSQTFRTLYQGSDLELINNNKDFYKVVDNEHRFFIQDLYLKSDSPGVITIDSSKLIFQANQEENAKIASELTKDHPEDIERVKEELNNVVNSLRFSVLIDNTGRLDQEENEIPNEFYIVNPSSTDEDNREVVPFFGVLDLHNQENVKEGDVPENARDGYFDYIDNDELKSEVLFGDVDDSVKPADIKYIANKTISASELSSSNSVFLANTKDGIKHIDVTRVKGGVEQSIGMDEIEENIQIHIKDKDIRHIKLAIYLEGWDIDNTDNLKYASFYTSFSFKFITGAF